PRGQEERQPDHRPAPRGGEPPAVARPLGVDTASPVPPVQDIGHGDGAGRRRGAARGEHQRRDARADGRGDTPEGHGVRVLCGAVVGGGDGRDHRRPQQEGGPGGHGRGRRGGRGGHERCHLPPRRDDAAARHDRAGAVREQAFGGGGCVRRGSGRGGQGVRHRHGDHGGGGQGEGESAPQVEDGHG
ncbi:hypothetical protein THAOC_23716, partial [Thalassiosira oceanica]